MSDYRKYGEREENTNCFPAHLSFCRSWVDMSRIALRIKLPRRYVRNGSYVKKLKILTLP